jgi:hypothetical protein
VKSQLTENRRNTHFIGFTLSSHLNFEGVFENIGGQNRFPIAKEVADWFEPGVGLLVVLGDRRSKPSAFDYWQH